MNPFASEPVWSLVAGLGTVVNAGLGLLLVFGVPISSAQMLGINTFVAVVISWLLRARVAPTSGTQDGSTIGPAGSPAQVARNEAAAVETKKPVGE